MPRDSVRSTLLKNLYDVFHWRMSHKALRMASDEENEREDELDFLLLCQLHQLENTRYLFRLPYRTSNLFIFKEDMTEVSGNETTFLNDREFIQKYRMSKDAFGDLLQMIQDHPVFGIQNRNDDEEKRGRRQTLVKYQLGVLLKVLGTEGSGSSNPELRNVFRNGSGTNDKFVKRVSKAIVDRLTEDFYTWPDEEEREDIGNAFGSYLFHHCVGIMDGTLFPLAFKPEVPDYPDYKGRKFTYSLSVLIVCDHLRRIRYYYAGWPGSVHDNRIFRNSKLYKDPKEFFSDTQYILADSAYEADWFVIPGYKKLPNRELQRNQKNFNSALGSARVISEHCIGILKARFPFLKSIRHKIRGKKSLKKILLLLDVAVLLHNFLRERNEAIPDEWDCEADDVTAVDGSAPEGYSLNGPVPQEARKDTRRLQLTALVNDYYV